MDRDKAMIGFEILSNACLPARKETIMMGLTKARIKTKRRKEDDFNEELTLEAYREIFQQWPADCACAVLATMHTLEDGWWPSAASVEERLRIEARGRTSLRDRMREASEREPESASPYKAPPKDRDTSKGLRAAYKKLGKEYPGDDIACVDHLFGIDTSGEKNRGKPL